MKKLITFTFLLIGLTGFSQEETIASKLKFGVKTGLNISSTSLNMDLDLFPGESYDVKSKTGFQIGGIANYQLQEKIQLQTELLFSQLGYEILFKRDESFGDTYRSTDSYKLNYLQIPIIAKYNIYDNLYIEGGIETSILLSGKLEFEYVEDNVGEDNDYTGSDTYNLKSDEGFDVNSIDFGLNIGLSYEYKKFLVTARYSLGLTNVNSIPSDDFWVDDLQEKDKNRNFAISVGYFFM